MARLLILLAILVGTLSTGTILPARAADTPWFVIPEDQAADWVVSQETPDGLRLTVRHKERTGAPAKRVLVLYPRASSAYDVAIGNILDAFQDKKVDAQFTILNYQNQPKPGMAAIDFAKQMKPDLMYAMGSESAQFLYDNYKNGQIPVVTVCAKDPVLLGQMKDYDAGSGTNFAYTSLNMPIEVQMAYLLEMKPNLKSIGILVDAKNISAVQTQADPIAAAARAKGIKAIDVTVADPSKAREELAVRVPAAVAQMRQVDPELKDSVFWVTGSTAVFKEIDLIIQHTANVPVLSVVPEVVKPGADSAVLSIGISFESNAQLAAIYGLDILSGRSKPGDLKVGIVSPPDIAINFLRARAIGLKMPFSFFEAASFVYDYEGKPVRVRGQTVAKMPGQS